GSNAGAISGGVRDALSAADAVSGCSPQTQAQQIKTICVLNSIDPNEIAGPVGYGAARYVSANAPLRYSIFFENSPTATAPAHQVVVSVHLDPAKVTLGTFTLGPIAFGNTTVAVPSGLGQYSTQVDLRPGKDLLVSVTGVLNSSTGDITWRFTSIDPATGLPP